MRLLCEVGMGMRLLCEVGKWNETAVRGREVE